MERKKIQHQEEVKQIQHQELKIGKEDEDDRERLTKLPTKTVVDQFSTKYMSKRAKRARGTDKRVINSGSYDGSPWKKYLYSRFSTLSIVGLM